jgi:uncharacterized RDD family membrane protein YckC
VIQTCKKCGALNEAGSEQCCFCHEPLENDAAEVSPAAVAGARAVPRFGSPEGSVPTVPAWRAEVSERLRGYRARHAGQPAEGGVVHDGGAQPTLPFMSNHEQQHPASTADEELDDPLQASLSIAAARVGDFEAQHGLPFGAKGWLAPRTEISESLLIDVSHPPQSAVRNAARHSTGPFHDEPGVSPAIPVAELSIRRRSALVDALCLLLAFSSVVGLYLAFGGKLVPTKLDVGVCAATLLLLYVQYFTLFTVMGGTTPGMMFTGLRLVSFEGRAPAPSRLLWRSFGYLISGVTALLGFFWALWDEDGLTWHDRISQTFLTRAEFLDWPPGREDPPAAPRPT